MILKFKISDLTAGQCIKPYEIEEASPPYVPVCEVCLKECQGSTYTLERSVWDRFGVNRVRVCGRDCLLQAYDRMTHNNE